METWSSEHFIAFAKVIPLTFAALFPVVNPIGTAIILLGITGPMDRTAQRPMAFRIAFNSAVILTAVLFGGSYLLSFFGITIPIVQAAGGLVLASMGWNMLGSSDSDKKNDNAPTSPGSFADMTFYPFTFPITVGPGCVAVTLTLSAHSRQGGLPDTIAHQAGVFVGIIAIVVLVYLSFVYSDLIGRRLGPSGMKVLLRLMAFVLVCVGAEIFWNGASTLILDLLAKAPR